MDRFKDRLRQYVELVPVLLFCVCIIQFCAYFMSEYFETTVLIAIYFKVMQQIFEVSLIFLICLYYISYIDRWHPFPKLCLYGVTALWVNNLPYILFDYELGVYFTTASLVIYIIVLIFALRILTNR